MANKDSAPGFRSLTGQTETAEPAGNHGAKPTVTRRESNMQKSQPQPQSQSHATPSTSTPKPVLRKSSSTNLAPQVSSPLAQSPRTSRNTSPIRKDKPPTPSGTSSSQPSAAAIQRALSASSAPQLQQSNPTASEAVSRLPRGNRTAPGSGETTPSWPLSPRLKSPPPSGPNSRRSSATAQKRPDAPSIQVLSATPQNNSPIPQITRQMSNDPPRVEPPQLQPPPVPKSSARGASGKSMLETVQENSSDSQEPSPAAIQAAADLKPLTRILEDEPAPSKRDSPKSDDQKTQLGESGSESAGNKSDPNSRDRRNSASQSTSGSQTQGPKNASRSTNPPSGAKGKQTEGKQFSVETEKVQSIPQSGLAPASENANRLRTENGTVKLKPSTETIRPKKERKKAERKTRSVNQGSATSKADLFEARVAYQVEEANTSDSDETFVYESNPPEPQRRQRHHSRTPSVTSSHSMAEQQRGTLRTYADTYDDRRVGGKRSMKFSSNPYNDVDSPESKDGTIRSHTPRHIGRFGRGGHHSATYDQQQESPFTQASRVRQNRGQRSRPNSPKSPHSMQYRSSGGLFSSGRKQEEPYDFDVEQNADDERTPLVGTVRGPRNFRQTRHIASSATSMDNYPEPRRRWGCLGGRAGSYFLTGLVVVLVVFSAIGFVLASNRALYNVEIRKLKNVLASEEELMLDLVVGAVNPNTLAVTITEMDLDIFAKSKHIGTVHPPGKDHGDQTRRLRKRRDGSRSKVERNSDGSEDLSDFWRAPLTLPDVERDAQTMLLGRVFHFDQGLTFDASPIKQHEHLSSGQVRLRKPGNDTETGGSARWEHIIQDPFELIVRGTLKYQLPISSRQQRAAVGATVEVHPEEGVDERGNMRVVPVDHSEHWQWVEWPDDEETNESSNVHEVD